MSAMPQSFDSPALRSAMTAYTEVAEQLDEAAADGSDARTLLDLAEAKAIAGMALRRRLAEAGWEPAAQRVLQ